LLFETDETIVSVEADDFVVFDNSILIFKDTKIINDAAAIQIHRPETVF
jgi:hypothetical protein